MSGIDPEHARRLLGEPVAARVYDEDGHLVSVAGDYIGMGGAEGTDVDVEHIADHERTDDDWTMCGIPLPQPRTTATRRGKICPPCAERFKQRVQERKRLERGWWR